MIFKPFSPFFLFQKERKCKFPKERKGKSAGFPKKEKEKAVAKRFRFGKGFLYSFELI